MKYQEYVEFCRTTESVPDTVTVDVERFQTVLELVIQSTELLDMLKKNIFYGKDVDQTKWLAALRKINKEMGEAMAFENTRLNHPRERDEVLDVNVRLAHSIIGMSTETGELLQALQKSVVEGEEFDTVNFGEELGDLQWYHAIGVDAAQLDFDQILQTNRTKLEKRYSSGSFSADEAINRDLDSEREILEDGIDDNDGRMSLDDKLNEDVEVIAEIIKDDPPVESKSKKSKKGS